MGYFSRLAVERMEIEYNYNNSGSQDEFNSLKNQLDYFKDRLEKLDAIRPTDRMHPEYDRYFEENFDTVDLFSVQGLLLAIDQLTRKIQEEQDKRFEQLNRMISMFNTGEDTDGQQVILAAFWCYPAVLKSAA